ncbi:MAG: serine hydrolase domain-containing protein [Sphingorhabdus sp.]
MRSSRFFIIILLAVLFGTLPTAHASTADIQTFVEREAKAASVPGVAYALIDGDQVHTGHFGQAKDDGGRSVSEQTAFAIGSISKSFTAFAIMQLREKGLLELDMPVSTYLPELEKAAVGAMTVRQLLSHTSGLSIVQGNSNQTDVTTDRDALKRRVAYLATLTPARAPGEVWDYSNANYQLLSRVVEVLSASEFGDYVESQILKPLGMNDSRMIDWEHGPDDAAPHRPWFWTKMQFDGRGTGRGSLGQGGVMASARDMATYLNMMMNGENDILTADSKAEMMQPASSISPSYGLGWFVAPERGLVFHSGANPGFEAFASMRPDQKKAFIILANGGSGFGFGETGYLRRGAAVLALGGPDERRPGWMMKAAFLLIVALPLFCLLGAWRSWKRRASIKAKGRGIAHSRIWMPLLAAVGFAYVLLIFLPGSFGVNIQTATFFQPDLGLLLTLSAIGIAIWAAIHSLVALYSRA